MIKTKIIFQKAVTLLLAIIGVTLIMNLSAYAQGNLQFNRVLLVGTSVETVPANKVWKAENFVGSATSGTCLTTSFFDCATYYSIYRGIYGLKVNSFYHYTGVPTIVGGVRYNTSSCTGSTWANTEGPCINVMPISFPIWFPAGTTINTLYANTYLSIIEFSIIP